MKRALDIAEICNFLYFSSVLLSSNYLVVLGHRHIVAQHPYPPHRYCGVRTRSTTVPGPEKYVIDKGVVAGGSIHLKLGPKKYAVDKGIVGSIHLASRPQKYVVDKGGGAPRSGAKDRQMFFFSFLSCTTYIFVYMDGTRNFTMQGQIFFSKYFAGVPI